VPIAREYAVRAIAEEGELGSSSSPITARVRGERELADWLLAPSEFVIRCLCEHGVPRERIVSLPYGVDPDAFRPAPAPRRDGVVRILFVGRVGLRKGVR